MAENETPQQPQEPASQPPQEQPQVPQAAEVPKDAKTMAMLCHLLAIFTSFLGPLIIWLVKKDDHPYIDEQGKEALNFQITVVIGYVISGLLWPLFCIGTVLTFAVWALNLVFCIIATVKTNNGEHYRYPIALRLIK